MIRYRNRLASMKDDRLPKIVYNWEKSLNIDSWSKSVDFILSYVNMLDDTLAREEEKMCHVDLDVVKSRLLKICREKCWTSSLDMAKLCTYRELFDEQDHMIIVYTNLTRRQRSLVVKLKIGILPLGVEVGRFTNKPLEERICHICDDALLDNEFHFLLYCEALKPIRSKYFEEYNYLDDCTDPTDKVELCKLMLNSHNLKHTARFLESMFDERMRLLYAKKSDEEGEE